VGLYRDGVFGIKLRSDEDAVAGVIEDEGLL
jgi:hypothetical protein